MTNIKRMPMRYYEGAPAIVIENVAAIYGPFRNTPCPFDVLFRDTTKTASETVGLDFDGYGATGCHFFLTKAETSSYRAINVKRKVKWSDLPAKTQAAIIAYLERD